MSKFIAKKVYTMTNEDDELVVCFVANNEHKSSAKLCVSEVKDKAIDVEVKPYKSKRSVEQNRLLWLLLGKLANAMSGSKRRCSVDEAYVFVLEEANVKTDYILALPEAEPILKASFRVVRKIGERVVNGKTLNMYQYFVGSSKYDTKEMTELIEVTLDKLAELGVYDSEIETARVEYQ